MTYLPPHFRVDDPNRIAAMIEANPLATLVAPGEDGLEAHHLPLFLDRRSEPYGALIGHVARNNALWSTSESRDVLVIFKAADAYITPNWYPTKQETHEVVPTWNYVVVHAWGRLIVHDDAKWVRGAVGKLTQAMERMSTVPWKMGDAPQDYLRGMLGNIVGIEIPLRRIEGKWKASQNRSDADRNGAIEGLRARGSNGDDAMADVMASLEDS